VALNGPQEGVKVMLDEYRRRRDAIHGWLTANPAIKCVKPRGAFYLFPDISELLGGEVKTSADFAQRLIEQEHVALTPGEGFDAPGYLRISYATSMDQLREGATRILRLAESLQPKASAVR
jgi:aspartate aminotransferase